MADSLPVTNAITVDVEDCFHPSEVQKSAGLTDWTKLPSRVEIATREVLDLFAAHGVKGTFFVLGWVAEKHPALLRAIVAGGHEVGCHSYAHQLVYELTRRQFRDDTLRAQAVIADACGVLPRAYRAPSYSIVAESMWALEVLAECGFTHDSSIYPIAHDRYGIPGFRREAHLRDTPSGAIVEIPVASVRLSSTRTCPVGGGAYLRLLPYRYTAAGIRTINRDEGRPACIYFHPWEIDAGQPRLARGFIARARTYTGLARMKRKLERLLRDFRFSTIASVYPNEMFLKAVA
jgi:polysaccharide deacetylase family protein (PEP-CTERM system associated)